jgi:hypothetical protein
MKTRLISWLAVCVIGCAAVIIALWDSARRRDADQQYEQARLNLEAEIEAAKNSPGHRLAEAESVIWETIEPETLITRLISIKEAKQETICEAFFCFQGLVDAGTNAFPSIRNYATNGHNVTFISTVMDAWFNHNEIFGILKLPGLRNTGKPRKTSNAYIPATTRIGIIDVIRSIECPGPIKAEVLKCFLNSPANIYELVYCAESLLEIDPVAYHDIIIAAVRNGLAAPETDSFSNHFDRLYLFSFLVKVGDPEMAEIMSLYLYVNGKMDYANFSFISAALGEKCVSILADLLDNPDMTLSDRRMVISESMKYVGTNEGANKIFHDTFFSAETDNDLKKDMISNLAGFYKQVTITVDNGITNMSEEFQKGDPVSKENAQARLAFLEEMRDRYTPEEKGRKKAMERVFEIITQEMNYAINPSAYSEPPNFKASEIGFAASAWLYPVKEGVSWDGYENF